MGGDRSPKRGYGLGGLALNGLMVVLALFLVALNGLFVAAEFGFVKIRATQVERLVQEKKATAGLVKDATRRLDAYLSVSAWDYDLLVGARVDWGAGLRSYPRAHLGAAGHPAGERPHHRLCPSFRDDYLLARSLRRARAQERGDRQRRGDVPVRRSFHEVFLLSVLARHLRLQRDCQRRGKALWRTSCFTDRRDPFRGGGAHHHRAGRASRHLGPGREGHA